MRSYLIIILIGLVSGFIGIVPLLRLKADKYTVISAFVFFLLMPYVIFHMNFPLVKWWLKGTVISFGLILPLAIAAGKGNKKCIFPMLLMAVVVGAFITFLGHYLL